MTIRESLEQWERTYLSPYASHSADSKGRLKEEEQCDIRPVFQRDRDRIVHCRAFRRLKDKTQVFLSPEGDHYRTRLTHTLEVSQNARTIAKALKLNEELVEAIALGHYEVRDGILNHQTIGKPHTLEGKVVRFSDKIAYIHHDMDDAVRAGILTEGDVPAEIRKVIGSTPSSRLDHFIHDIVTASMGKNDIIMSEPMFEAMMKMREFMFDNVYQNPLAKSEESKAEVLMETLYHHFMRHIDEMPEEYLDLLSEGEAKEQVVCDYVASMTDRSAIAMYEHIYIPKSWSI